MEKEHFLFLTRNFNSLTAEEAVELISMKLSFPYCQLVHSLAARGAHDNALENNEQDLHLSAVYSTDRAVLKSIMASPRSQRQVTVIPTSNTVVEFVSPQKSIITIIETSANDLSGDELLAEITQDLNRLKQLKQEFEISFQKLEESTSLSSREDKRLKPTLEIVEPNTEALIKEIKSTKKKIKPEGDKQKEQFDIIDQFIKTQPSISISKSKVAPVLPTTDDLTESNSAFGDHIISETLVEILLKQGKKDKALEVLKKLIWKFPQKKAYFAAQIEELKK